MSTKYRNLSDEEKEKIELVKEKEQQLNEWLKKKYPSVVCPEQKQLKECK